MKGIKACPFCGGESRIIEAEWSTKNYPEYTIKCINDHGYGVFHDTQSQAVGGWNTRHKETEKPKPSLLDNIHGEKFSTDEKIVNIVELFHHKIKDKKQTPIPTNIETREMYLIESIVEILSVDSRK